jgi:hypothetical protein
VLGELVHESSGRIAGTRLLPTESGEVRIEVTAQGSGGRLLGQSVSTIATWRQALRQGGAHHGEGRVIFTTSDGEVAEWMGFGVGRSMGSPPAATFATCGSAQTTSRRLAHLNGIALVGECEIDEDGRWTWRLYEWLPSVLAWSPDSASPGSTGHPATLRWGSPEHLIRAARRPGTAAREVDDPRPTG